MASIAQQCVVCTSPAYTSRAFLLMFKKYSHEIYYRVFSSKSCIGNY